MAAHRGTYDLSLRAAILGTVTSSQSNSIYLDFLPAMIPPDLIPHNLSSRSTSDIITLADTQCLAVLAVYILSNALVEPKPEPASRFLQWIQNRKDRELSQLLLLPKGSTQAAALENIFWYALISQDDGIMQKVPSDIFRHLHHTSHPWLDAHIISLIDSNNDFHYRAYGPLSAFEYACFIQHIGLVRDFLDAGAEPAQLSIRKILRAIECRKLSELGHYEARRLERRIRFDSTIARLLIRRGMSQCHGFSPYIYAAQHWPPDHWQLSLPVFACRFNDVPLLEVLLEETSSHQPCADCLNTAAREIRSRTPESRCLIQMLNYAGVDVPLPTILRCDDDEFSLLKKLLDSGVEIKPDELMRNCVESTNLSSLSILIEIIFHSQRHLTHGSPAIPNGTTFSLSHAIKSTESREKTHSVPMPPKTLISRIMSLPENLRSQYLQQALHAAIAEAKEDYIYALIDAGTPVMNTHVWTSVETCTLQSIQYLYQSLSEPCLCRYKLMFTYRVIRRGDVGIFHALLSAGLLSGYCNPDGYEIANSAAIAIRLGQFEIASLLINNDHFLDHETRHSGLPSSRVTPLEAAIQAGRLDLVDTLLAKGAGVNDDRALRAAVPAGYNILQQMLSISISGSFNCAANFGIPALHLAIVLGQMQAMELLLNNAVKVHLQYGTFDDSTKSGSKISWRLSEPCSQIFQPDLTIFETAIIVDRSPGLPVLRSVFNAWHQSGRPSIGPVWASTSPLLLAIKHSNAHAIEFFLEESKEDLNTTKELGYPRTPLQCAAENGNLKLAQRLIAMGANVNESPMKQVGVTSLQIASRKGYFRIVEVLLEAGADPNLPGPMPWLRTPLEEAAQMGRVDIITLLMAQKNFPGDNQIENARRLATEEKFTTAAELVDSLYQERLARLFVQQPAEEDWTVERVGNQVVGADPKSSAFNGLDDLASGLIMTEMEISDLNYSTEGDVLAPWEWPSVEIAGFDGFS
jgi:ankyrin repeat protein